MLDQILRVIRENTRFFITTHRRPDGDAIGSQLALGRFLSKLGKQVTMINADPLSHNLSWLPGADAVELFDSSVDHHTRIGNAEVVVVVDTNAADRIGKVGGAVRSSRGKKVLIDHHVEPERWFDLMYRREMASSTGELIYEIIAAYDPALIDAEIAAALYTAIMTDTGSFRYSNVTPAVHRILADLLERGGIQPDDIHAAVYDTRSLHTLRLMARAFESIRLRYGGQFGYMMVTERMLQETDADQDDTEGFVNYLLSIEGVRVGLIFIESGSGIKISFRSKGTMHVHAWAHALGGGGHRNASGAYVRGRIENVIERVVGEAPRYLPLATNNKDEGEDTLSSEDEAYLSSLLKMKAKTTR